MLWVVSVALTPKETFQLVTGISVEIALLGVSSLVFRKPWRGKVLKDELAEQVQQEKLFEDISSFHDLHESLLPDLQGPKQLTEKEKRDALKKTYEDPFDDVLKIMKEHIEDLLEPK